jgi:hypothetical protein
MELCRLLNLIKSQACCNMRVEKENPRYWKWYNRGLEGVRLNNFCCIRILAFNCYMLRLINPVA